MEVTALPSSQLKNHVIFTNLGSTLYQTAEAFNAELAAGLVE
jgi:hypothetical protein